MSTETYLELLQNPEATKQEHASELKAILEQYPYFQSARALYLKELKKQDSFRYNNELKITAAHTMDRSVLFNFITSTSFNKQEDIQQQINKKIAEEENKETPKKEETLEIEVVKEELEIGKPISFTQKETHSFNEWLQLSSKKPIVREDQKPTPSLLDKLSIIDKFIKDNPKITPVKKETTKEVDVPGNKKDKSLMTATLAKVYLEQKKYGKAIKAYEILSLKYPEKSGFFADQIKKIKILQKNKS